MIPWLRRHHEAWSDAWNRLAAQPVASAAAVLVIALAIALPLLAYVVAANAARAAGGLDTDPHLHVFLALDASDADVKRVDALLRAHPEAGNVRFIPRTRALEDMKATTHLAELLAQLEQNPLPHAFSVRMRTTDVARLGQIREAWLKVPGVDDISGDFAWADKLARAARFAQRAVGVLIVALAAAVVFIVGHLIRLQVVMRREEIELSQLLGATAADVRRPFLYHGVLQALAATGLALAIGAGGTAWLNAEMLALTSAYAADLKIIFLDPVEVMAVAAAAALLALTGSWWSVSRELRRFSEGT